MVLTANVLSGSLTTNSLVEYSDIKDTKDWILALASPLKTFGEDKYQIVLSIVESLQVASHSLILINPALKDHSALKKNFQKWFSIPVLGDECVRCNRLNVGCGHHDLHLLAVQRNSVVLFHR